MDPIPTVVMYGIPFHVVHQRNILRDSTNFMIENDPVYETLDDEYFSEISNVESDRFDVGSTSYQASKIDLTAARTSEKYFQMAHCISAQICLPPIKDSFIQTDQRREYKPTGFKSGEHV